MAKCGPLIYTGPAQHYTEVIMGAIASHVTSLTIVYSFRCRSKKTSKLRVTGLCVGIHRSPMNSPHKWPVTRKNVSIWWRHHVKGHVISYHVRSCRYCMQTFFLKWPISTLKLKARGNHYIPSQSPAFLHFMGYFTDVINVVLQSWILWSLWPFLI